MKNLNVYTYTASGSYSSDFGWNDGGNYLLGACLGVLNNNLLAKLQEDKFFKADLKEGVCQNYVNDYAGNWQESGYVVASSRRQAEAMLSKVAEKCYQDTYKKYVR